MAESRELNLKIAKLSHLARLELQDGDAELISTRMEKILEAFESLQNLNLVGVEPLYGLNEQMHTREDQTTKPISRDSLMVNAADSHDGAYRVGRVVRSE